MRSSLYGMLSWAAGLALMAAAAVTSEREVVVGDDIFEPRPRAPALRPEPAERVITEADNTRLRQAAERRYRKAQRQAKGMESVAKDGAAPGTTGQRTAEREA